MTTFGASRAHPPGRSPARIPIVLVAAFSPLAACGDGTAPALAEPAVRDSAGVVIVEHPGSAHPAEDWTADLDAALSLPGDFFRVMHALRLDDGRIAVVEQGERRITFFSPEGNRLAAVGGEGEGPGEFRQINGAFRWPGDSILVFDIQLRRLTLFDGEGRLGRTFQLEVTEDVPFGAPQGVHADGTILATGFTQSPPGGPEDGRQRYHSPAHAFHLDGGLRDVTLPPVDAESYFRTIDQGFTVMPLLFGRRTRLHAGPDFVLEAANDTYELRVHSLDGELEQVIRRVGVEAPVTQALRRDAVERTLEDDRSNRDPAELRRILESMPVPETLPAFDRVLVDRTGRIWVEGYEPAPTEGSEWLVFDREGLLVARLELPRRFQPMEIGEDYLLGVLTDELDVERVLMAPLRSAG